MIHELAKMEERRQLLLIATEKLTVDQYNFIPAGFNNNIIWNIGHMLVTGDSMLYGHANLPRPNYLVDMTRYEKGSIPDSFIGQEEIDSIRTCFLQTIRNFKSTVGLDQNSDVSSMKISSNSVSNQVGLHPFLLFHEEMHFRKIRMTLMLLEN